MDSCAPLEPPKRLRGKMPGPSTPEKAAKLWERYLLMAGWHDDGHSHGDIGRAFNVTGSAVGYTLRNPPPEVELLPQLAPPDHIRGRLPRIRDGNAVTMARRQERWTFIQEMREAGYTILTIAKALRVEGSSVDHAYHIPAPAPDSPPYIEALGDGLPVPPLDIRGYCIGAKDARRDWIRQQGEKGHEVEEMAKALGVTPTLIRHALGQI